ncbi:MAG: deoxyribonuclease IV [Chloroflexi bacterium]|nr:MAG: deoxyribonuclease IV [Chloroflexota bacterium]
MRVRRSLAFETQNPDVFGRTRIYRGRAVDVRRAGASARGRVHADFPQRAAALAGAASHRRADPGVPPTRGRNGHRSQLRPRHGSIDNLSACVACAERIGLAGVVVHVGSGRGQPIDEAEVQVSSALEQVLSRSNDCPVLLENSAGSGDTLGSRFQQIGAVFDRLGRDARLGLCLDTAHTFASGYDLRADDGIQQAVDEIDSHVGIERLKLIHANDSKVGLGSAVDRHENIGHGFLGDEAFRRMLAHHVLKGMPWVVEAPGYDGKGPDLQNVRDLKRLAGRG